MIYKLNFYLVPITIVAQIKETNVHRTIHVTFIEVVPYVEVVTMVITLTTLVTTAYHLQSVRRIAALYFG